jgi:hypothetical protein
MRALAAFAGCSDFESTGRPWPCSFDPPNLGGTLHRDAVSNEFMMNQGAEFGVNCGKYFWQLFDLYDT